MSRYGPSSVDTSHGRHRVQGNPLGFGRTQDARPFVAPYLGAGVNDLRQGGSALLQHQGGKYAQTIAAPWTGSNFGGNNPTVRPEVNTEIRETRIIDRTFLQVGDTEQGQFVFSRRASGATDPVIQERHHVLSLARFNYYLRYGPGRQKYHSNNAMCIMNDWSFDGMQQSKMPPESSANFQDSISVTVFTAGYFQCSDVWTVNRTFKGGVDIDSAVELDHLFFVLRRHREENPYTRAKLGKDFDDAFLKQWEKQKSSQYYWSCDPVSLRTKTPDEGIWTNLNPATPDENYVGGLWYVGQLICRTKRAAHSRTWQSLARRAVYPQQLNADYLTASGSLPLIEIKVRL